ncbi:head GIN domain-containing protein [Pseudobacter ginsenosidimutans]|uniref:Putative autotransporter adhesin-like protein n=1 Tax=Pseudobacter ginsenosidimutans TaxID=661488 RepID=A0A4V2F077_9BACT|nr:head GIN domain-containing protein [Pseudobacter ginsenosidimutans]QEC40366.1 DUF2807 domain-containing protein [Pseudobacter ginsenosidimutans]RZS69030.1 putative autotransporter adhesin-like protein [Pseudobacter ginsenosidimutans]
MKNLLVLLLPIALIVSSSCSFVGGKKVRGKGEVRTESRSVTQFSGVSTSGSFDIYVSSGPQEVKIEAEDNLLEYIETYINDGVLRIRTKDGFSLRPTKNVKVFVTNPTFNKIHSSGSGNIIGQNKIISNDKLDLSVSGSADINLEVDAPEVESEISGSGNTDLKGATKKFETKISGSGNVRALDLMSEETEVKITGSGDVSVFASVKLTVRVTGSGDVRYKGNATVDSKITGGGGVTKLE